MSWNVRKRAFLGTLVLCIAMSLCSCDKEKEKGQPEMGELPGVSVKTAVDTARTVDESGDVSVDFDALKAQNKDIYAWITIPGTCIDYPVLQKKESDDLYDNFYLNHTVDLVEGFPGAIYSQPVNAVDFSDPVTVLYGHNMKDGSMFYDLHKFEDTDFFKSHDAVLIYTSGKELTYQITAAVSFTDDLIPYLYDFSSKDGLQAYLDDIAGREGNIREDIEMTVDNKILVLSTCYSDRASERLLILGVLAEEQY